VERIRHKNFIPLITELEKISHRLIFRRLIVKYKLLPGTFVNYWEQKNNC